MDYDFLERYHLGKDRRKKNKAVWIERRVGDDYIWSQEIQRWLYFQKSLGFASLLIALAVLNYFDFYFTSIALSKGAVEVNPLMVFLFQQGVDKVAMFKMGAVSVAILLLWFFKHFRLTFRLTLFATSFYFFLCLYHCMCLGVLHLK